MLSHAVMDFFCFAGHRLIDPEPPWSWEEVQELWRHIRETFAKDHSRPGSRASQHKRY